jgi:hypothetical protein
MFIAALLITSKLHIQGRIAQCVIEWELYTLGLYASFPQIFVSILKVWTLID